jgi:Large ribosomal RNA subunit accumulation protein YceD
MTEDVDRPVLSRPFKVDEIKDGASVEIVANDAELAAMAKMLDLVALERVTFTCRFDHRAGGRIRLTGTLRALATQTCVISLEPVEATLEVPVEQDFWPASLIAQLEQNTAESGGAGILDWPEPIVDGMIDLGAVIYESLATALDPYPKREGASFDWSQAPDSKPKTTRSGPFAALAALKRR